MLTEERAAPAASGEPSGLPPLDLRPDSTALFLDCDGTLAEIVDTPSAAFVPPPTLDVVRRLHALCGGALAIVSGRSLQDVDRLFAPLVLPVAGTHGMERRDATGSLHLPTVDRSLLAAATDQLDAFAGTHPCLIVERKPSAVALHYRQRPDLADAALSFARSVAARHAPIQLQLGKAVAELGFGRATKADAIEAFMDEAPFGGRKPIFIGDDLTDEHGFEAVARMRGIAIKVGPGPTAAGWRLADPPAVARYLERLAMRWATDSLPEETTGRPGS